MTPEFRRKIIALFEYRQLPALIRFGDNQWDESFYEHLITLQYKIYLLDSELERHWKVDPDIIDDCWQDIYLALENLGIPRTDHDRYCQHIYKYQRHELNMRQGKLPTRYNMEYFYYYKSCDVKLLRRIIAEENGALESVFPAASWRLFDLVTEVNDDVTDLQEDALTTNGNRFLLSLLLYGREKTTNIYSDFLDQISQRNKTYPYKKESQINVREWVEYQVGATKEILEPQAETFRDLDVSRYLPLLSRAAESK